MQIKWISSVVVVQWNYYKWNNSNWYPCYVSVASDYKKYANIFESEFFSMYFFFRIT